MTAKKPTKAELVERVGKLQTKLALTTFSYDIRIADSLGNVLRLDVFNDGGEVKVKIITSDETKEAPIIMNGDTLNIGWRTPGHTSTAYDAMAASTREQIERGSRATPYN